MKFAIITQAKHKQDNGSIYAYEPYVREMNLWLKYTSEVKIVTPICSLKPEKIDTEYDCKTIELVKIPDFHILSIKATLLTLLRMPLVFYRIVLTMKWADHIHLRCPGNIALLGCVAQVFFPHKPKTVKYAGNWAPNSKQPLSYRFQKWILSNTLLSKNCKVLVYGEWENQSSNIVPFYTASYYKKDIKKISATNFDKGIKLLFVGTLSKGKQPILSVKIAEQLHNKGYAASLDIYGEGAEKQRIQAYIKKHELGHFISLHGNQPKDVVTSAFERSHFLVFISKSEGWPKVVAEAMFWSCLPISSKVSCVPYMLNQGRRGALVNPDIDEIQEVIVNYIHNFETYSKHVENGAFWSHQFTLDKFEADIKEMI